MKAISVDVISDVICPWCFLGKRRLDKAINLLEGIKVEVNWRPFFLDPTIPAEGISRKTYLENKFGAERLKTIHDPILAAGKEDGVPYSFERITRTPNTMDAHRLIRWSHVGGKQHDVSERLFMAYFSLGLDIGDRAVLVKIAGEAGMDSSEVSAKLENGADVDAVTAEVEQAYRMGVTGVPCFIFAQKQGLMGAQPAEVLADAIGKLAA
ncbi:MAG TPA: DsbA family oxidoreductase [Aestuariivirga sp.]|nr:DsbA family oxidoreductase [Aestuariivirga sp.]